MCPMMQDPSNPQTRSRLLFLFVALLIFGAGFLIGHSNTVLSGGTAVSQEQPSDVDFGPLYASWKILEERFVAATTTEALSSDERVWGAIKGLANSYGDPYTVFFPPVEKQLF